MGTTQPIRDTKALAQFTEYYRSTRPNLRNYTLIQLGLHTALRISDLLSLQWQDIFDIAAGRCRTHISLTEKKTQKTSRIALCPPVQELLEQLYRARTPQTTDYIFSRSTDYSLPLSRSQAYRIVHKAAEQSIHAENISCHSLRKTFGYHAWKQGISPTLLMDIFNHSSFEITKRYLGITQDERDGVFLNVRL